MPAATYALYVDWDNDGNYSDPGEDITADWLTAEIERGFDGPLARVAKATRATFVVNNAGRDYSPALVSSVLPRRKVKFTMTYTSTVTLFEGYLEEITPDYGPKLSRRATLSCVCAMALLDLAEATIEVQQNAAADDIISALVAAVYTPASTSYQAGINQFPISGDRWVGVDSWSGGIVRGARGFQTVNASQKIRDVCASDWGRFYISKAGVPTFVNRLQMPLDATTELTLSDNMVGLSYTKRAGEVYNYVEVTCYPRTVGETLEVVGALDPQAPPRIDPSASMTFVLNYRDPANSAVQVGGINAATPVANTDILCTSDEAGEGDDDTASVSISMTAYADKAEVTLTNALARPTFVQALQVRAYAVRAREPVVVRKSDATSITAYQKRALAIQAPLMSKESEALRLAEYLLDVYKTPRDIVEGVVVLGNKSATFLAAVRDLELLDRVVVTETQTGLSSYAGHVYRMRHSIPNKHDHRLTLDLETGYSVGTPFRLDTSALNSGHVLVY